MKLLTLLSLLSVATAFGVAPRPVRPVAKFDQKPAAFRTEPIAQKSALIHDAALVRGGAIPGWAAYNEALDKYPLTAKACTSLVGWALGDFLAQTFISGGPFDMKRFISFSAFGFLYHGPSGHFFYNFLDKLIPGSHTSAVVTKVAIDQILWCPMFLIVFFTYLGLVNGDSMAVIGDKIKADLLTGCQGSWKVWPLVHAVNFKFISTKHRLVFINGVQIAFNMFLSLIGSK